MGNFGDDFDAEKTKEDVAARLEQRFPDHDAAELQALAGETVDEYVDAPVKGFIDTVAEHEASERIRREDRAV